jgi:hypothetical protein
MSTTSNLKAKGGYYLSTSRWNVEVIPEEGGTLPAGKFIRVPFPLLFAVVPVIGLAFLMFLPFIGFALMVYTVVRRFTGNVAADAAAFAATIAPEQATGAAHLTGQPGEDQAADALHPEVEKLAKEIESKRAT